MKVGHLSAHPAPSEGRVGYCYWLQIGLRFLCVFAPSLFLFTKALTQNLCENWNDVEDFAGEEKKEAEEESKKENDNQQEPEKDAGGSLGKPR